MSGKKDNKKTKTKAEGKTKSTVKNKQKSNVKTKSNNKKSDLKKESKKSEQEITKSDNKKSKKSEKKLKKSDEKKPLEKKEKTKSTKKIFLAIIALIIVISIIAVVFILQSPTPVKAQRVIESGNVEVKHYGGSWILAQNGMDLIQSDSVKTGSNSTASIIFFQSAVIRLDSNTEVKIDELIKEAKKTELSIGQNAGRTWNSVLKISGIDSYEVKTPTTVASVRGTAYDIKIHSGGKTTIGVNSGIVNVTAYFEKINYFTIGVKKNESVTIDPNNISKIPEIQSFEIDEWVLSNLKKDEELFEQVKQELYNRIEQYLPLLKETYGISDSEIDALLEGYILGYYDLPPETPDWIREIIELS